MVTSENFKEVLIKYLNLEDITSNEIEDDDSLFGDEGLGLDSVDSIELVLAIEKEYKVKIKNVKKLVSYLRKQKKENGKHNKLG